MWRLNASLVGLLLVLLVSDGGAQVQEEPASATIDFLPLTGLSAKDGRYGVRVNLKTAGKPMATQRVLFDGGSKGVAANVCATFAAAFEDAGWEVRREENRLTITGFKDDAGRFTPIHEIRVTSENQFAIEFVPRVTATGKVKVERDAKPLP